MAGISLARRTMYFPLLAAAAAAMNILLNFALIPPFGMVGAAIAAALSFGFLAVLHYTVAQRVYPTPFEPAKVLAPLAIATVLGSLGAMPIEPLPLALALKALAALTFLVSLLPARVLRRDELLEIRGIAGEAVRFATGRA